MPLPAFIAGAIPGIVSGVAGFLGGERASHLDRREAERNRAFQAGEAGLNRSFQERMRNTEWQSAVADMESAGINPALAYARGGASSPSGAMAGGSQAAPARDSVSSAMQAVRMRQDMELTKQTIAKTTADAEAARSLADRERVRNIGYGFQRRDGALAIDFQMPGLIDETRAGIAERMSAASRADAMARITGMGGQVAQGFEQIMPAFQSIMGVAGSGADSIANVVNFMERAARLRDETAQRMFGASRSAIQNMTRQLRAQYRPRITPSSVRFRR